MKNSPGIKKLDVRPIIPKEKPPAIFLLFDSLVKGETLHLINDHDPKPLFYEMSAERTGQFFWEYVESGPDVWKVNIIKVV